MASWRALTVAREADASVHAEIQQLTDDALMPGDVTIDVEYSSINYKDGLALTGRPGVVRGDFLVAGIDLVGVVAASDSASWKPGDRVILNGWGIGETHHGGLAERARVRSEWLVALPVGVTSHRAAAIGTAGLTAQLAVLALERAGSSGEVLVTGASGGVGSIATVLLAALGNRVTASTGSADSHNYLRGLGAIDIIERSTLTEPGKALQPQRWHAAIDSVGGATLANVLAQTRYGGTVASCGLVGDAALPSTVMPFILRAVSLVGINSVQAPLATRLEAWDRLSRDLDPHLLDSMTTTVPLSGAIGVAERIVAGQVRGRTVVDVRT